MWLLGNFELYFGLYYTSIRSWLSQLYLHPSSILLALTIHSPPHFWLLFYKWEMELFAFTGILYHTFSLPSMSNFRMFFIKQTSVSIVYGIFGSHDLSIYSLVLCPRFSKSVSFFFPKSFSENWSWRENWMRGFKCLCWDFYEIKDTRYYLTSAFSEHHWASDSSSTPWKLSYLLHRLDMRMKGCIN